MSIGLGSSTNSPFAVSGTDRNFANTSQKSFVAQMGFKSGDVVATQTEPLSSENGHSDNLIEGLDSFDTSAAQIANGWIMASRPWAVQKRSV